MGLGDVFGVSSFCDSKVCVLCVGGVESWSRGRMAWGGGGVEDGEGGGQRRRGGRAPVVAGWGGVVGAEAAVRAVEQTAGSVGVWGEQHVLC